MSRDRYEQIVVGMMKNEQKKYQQQFQGIIIIIIIIIKQQVPSQSTFYLLLYVSNPKKKQHKNSNLRLQRTDTVHTHRTKIVLNKERKRNQARLTHQKSQCRRKEKGKGEKKRKEDLATPCLPQAITHALKEVKKMQWHRRAEKSEGTVSLFDITGCYIK
eukprot:gene11399-7904_t